MHERVTKQSNSELSSSSPTQSVGSPHIQIDIQIVYDIRLRRSTYTQKDKEITFPITLVTYPTKFRVICNH
jgi:hypothetical protein